MTATGWRARFVAPALTCLALGPLAGCTSAARPDASSSPAGPTVTASSPAPAVSTTAVSTTAVSTTAGSRAAGPTSQAPVDVGPTTASNATSCPLLKRSFAQDTLGMRLDRIAVLRAGGRVVGCRIYALQNSPLHASEHLPGPRQPAVEVTATGFPSAVGAHNALARLADRGTSPQQHAFGGGVTGVCFQSAFDPADRGADWGCGYTTGRTLVLVRTVVTSPALNAVLVTRAVRRAL